MTLRRIILDREISLDVENRILVIEKCPTKKIPTGNPRGDEATLELISIPSLDRQRVKLCHPVSGNSAAREARPIVNRFERSPNYVRVEVGNCRNRVTRAVDEAGR